MLIDMHNKMNTDEKTHMSLPQLSMKQRQGYDPNSIMVRLSGIYTLLAKKKFIMTTEQLISTLLFTSSVFVYLIVIWRSALLMVMFVLYLILVVVWILFMASKYCYTQLAQEYETRKILADTYRLFIKQRLGASGIRHGENKGVYTGSDASGNKEKHDKVTTTKAKNSPINSSASSSEKVTPQSEKLFVIDPDKLKTFKSYLASPK